MTRKRRLLTVLTVVLLLLLTACGGPAAKPSDPTTKPSAVATSSVISTTEAPLDTTVTEPSSTGTTTASTTVTPSSVGTSRTRVTTWTTRTYSTRPLPTTVSGTRPIVPGGSNPPSVIITPTIASTEQPMIDNLQFGGATFTFADYGALGTIPEAQIAAFEAAHGVNLTVDHLPTDSYLEEVLAASAAGKPYSIVRVSSETFPEPITARAVQPLESYLSRGDLWTPAKKSGFSWQLMNTTALYGHVYAVGGSYRQAPSVIYYNKAAFAAAGYTGKQDPLALYTAGTWDWKTLHEMLLAVQRPADGIYGISFSAASWGPFLNSYNTDLTKVSSVGQFVENYSDPTLYAAYEMLQDYCCGNRKVISPHTVAGSDAQQFLNGTTVALLSDTTFYGTALSSLPGGSANLGVVPLPTDKNNGPHSIRQWDGFGAGFGASEDGVRCALMFAKHDSAYNHTGAYHPSMPAKLKTVLCAILDSDALIAPYSGFPSSAGSLGNIRATITDLIAIKDQNITVVLKGYKKITQTIIDTAL